MSGDAKAKSEWNKRNRKGRGAEDIAYTYTEIMRLRGYDLPKKTKAK